MIELTLTLQKELDILKQKNNTLYNRVKNLNRTKLRLKKTINSQQKLIQNLTNNENTNNENATNEKICCGELLLDNFNEWEDANDLLKSCEITNQ